jgi:hypothetical protein
MKTQVLLTSGALTALLCWLAISALPPSAPRAGLPASEAEPRRQSGSDGSAAAAPPSRAPIEPDRILVADAFETEEPWSDAALAREPKDQFAMPLRHVPFLHACLNRSATTDIGVSGKHAFYGIDVGQIISTLPVAARDAARGREAELGALVSEYKESARVVEMEQWRQRYQDYHLAVQAGRFTIVEHAADSSESERAQRNKATLDGLGLGQMNRDYVYIISTTRTQDDQKRPASAIIYLTRTAYPKTFEMLDELRRLREEAQRVLRARLGVFDLPRDTFPK